MKKILALFAVLLAVSGIAIAMNPADVTATDQSRWTGGMGLYSNQDLITGGDLTYVFLDEGAFNFLTDRWSGYYGNISSGIYLRDNTNTTAYLFSWTTNATDITNGEVCASTNNSFDFSSAAATTAAEIDSAWGFAGGLDQAIYTFNDGLCNLTFTQDSWSVNNTIKADEDSGTSAYSTCAIEQTATPTKNDIAFCTDRIRPATGANYNFKGQLVNYEFIVATDDSAGATETYYFFMEIDG